MKTRFCKCLFLLLLGSVSWVQAQELPPDFEALMNGGSAQQEGDDFLSLESMMRDVSTVTDTAGIHDTLIRFIPEINPNISIKSFNWRGVWELVYKEYLTRDMHIEPYNNPTEQKKCLFGKLVFGENFFYGNTTCLANFSLFDNPKKLALSVDKVVNDDNIPPKRRYIYQALKERYDIDKLNVLEIKGQSYESEDTYEYFVLNDSVMVTLFDNYVFFLKRLERVEKSINVEKASSMIEWEMDNKGYKMIVGKNTGTVYDFLDSAEISSKDPAARLHIIYYPPKLGQNFLQIHNLYINNETGQMDQKLLYANKEPLNNIKHIYIPPRFLLSSLIKITLDNSMNKKYSWGIKYKLMERKNVKIKKKKVKNKESSTEDLE